MHHEGALRHTGIDSDRADAHFTDCFVVDYSTGMRMDGATNRLTRCHILGGTNPPGDIPLTDWSSIYACRKKQFCGGVYGNSSEAEKITVGTEKLYEGSGESVRWSSNVPEGFEKSSCPDDLWDSSV